MIVFLSFSLNIPNYFHRSGKAQENEPIKMKSETRTEHIRPGTGCQGNPLISFVRRWPTLTMRPATRASLMSISLLFL